MSTKRNVAIALAVVAVATVAGTEVYEMGYSDGLSAPAKKIETKVSDGGVPGITERLLRNELEDANEKLADCQERLSLYEVEENK